MKDIALVLVTVLGGLGVFLLGMKHLSLDGFHCHVGSQVFDEDVFCRSAAVSIFP